MQKLLIICSIILSCLAPIKAQDLIHINTNDNSLILRINNAKVYQHYFGKKLADTKGLEYLSPDTREIYPSFGNGDNQQVALLARHADGTMATDLIYQSHQQLKEDNTVETIIYLKDKKLPFFVDVHYKAYQEENVFEEWVVIHHKERKTVVLKQFASASLGVKASNYYLTHFYGSWAKEMQLNEQELTNGTKCVETTRGVRATEYENPSFVLSLNQKANDINGEVIMGALAWSGNFQFKFQVDEQNRCQTVAGINPFASEYQIKKNEKFTTPKLVFTYSSTGKNQGSINLHRWARRYNLRDGEQIRPIVLNSWEGAYFKFDANKIKSMMDGAAELGAEMFVLDDGWFGNKYPRNSDKMGLGDWQVNKEKLPQGINGLIDYAEGKGLKFGIWVEPEMVNPKSELAEKHPEWIIQRMNNREAFLQRNQLILDLSNPKVQDFVFGVIDEILVNQPRISYIKWDANRHIQNYGSTYLDDEKQSHLWIEYVKGLENVYHRLAEKYPGVIIQTCASGGGRVEFGVLKYTHEFWTSDDTDPYERLFIQWGTNHFYPAIATGAHVTKSPNHQSGRTTSLKFRFDVAMTGRLGLELSPDQLNKQELKYAKKCVINYKTIRPIIQFGDMYRLQSPYDNDGYASINYVSKDKSKAVLFVYSHELHRRDERNAVKMQGLDSNASYRIIEINKNLKKSVIACDEKIISGDILMDMGLRIDLKRPMTSAVFTLEKIKE